MQKVTLLFGSDTEKQEFVKEMQAHGIPKNRTLNPDVPNRSLEVPAANFNFSFENGQLNIAIQNRTRVKQEKA